MQKNTNVLFCIIRLQYLIFHDCYICALYVHTYTVHLFSYNTLFHIFVASNIGGAGTYFVGALDFDKLVVLNN